jgi:hypothetical protein
MDSSPSAIGSPTRTREGTSQSLTEGPVQKGVKILGHSQLKTTQRYSHLAPETLLNAADAAARAAGLGKG